MIILINILYFKVINSAFPARQVEEKLAGNRCRRAFVNPLASGGQISQDFLLDLSKKPVLNKNSRPFTDFPRGVFLFYARSPINKSP